MATSKCYYPRPDHRFFSGEQVTEASDFELDEWDLYNTGSDSTPGFNFGDLTINSGRTGTNRKKSSVSEKSAANSLPVNVPDWSKILGKESRRNQIPVEEEEVDGDEFERRVPPHELLARRRMASFSVHEGVGRTLKGRDLSRVRNTIFKITGFED